jgi:hypothetical protein
MTVHLPPGADAWISKIIQGLVTKGLYSLGGRAFRFRIRESEKGVEGAVRSGLTTAELTSVVGSGPLAEGSAQELRDFLLSPETEIVVRQLCCLRMSDSKNVGIASIREEFTKLFCGRIRGADEKLAAAVFEVALGAYDEALTAALDKGSLEALDAKNVVRHRLLLDELAAIENNLKLLSNNPEIPKILEFEERYRAQIASRHDSISPPHLDRHRKYPIDALYVVPNVTRYPDFVSRYPDVASRFIGHDSVPMSQLLETLHRAVLLGNPGAGKSTFALKLCHDLSTSGRLTGRRVTPILVVLRDYGAQKREHSWSILQFMSKRASAWYQVDAPPHAFEYLLLNGRAVVIFDGLDELLETSYRREVGDDIESFCNLYPATPVIVTSRAVGYEQAPLARKRFTAYRLADFTDVQVEEYAHKWFGVDEASTPEELAKKAKSFLSESQSVPDLRSNPLMLALMCNIYLGEDFIPANRPEVYKKCALMLFDRWDRSRRIDTGYTFESQLSPIMAHIAHWLYSNPELQSGVSEQQLVQACTKYLHPSRYEHLEEAERAAGGFIEFCRGRAWVFSDTGITPAGVNLYQFTHRTFLEYFTAHYLFRTNPRPTDLLKVLLPRIAKREWDVVAQLAFHIASREVEGASDSLISGLLSASGVDSASSFNLLTFACRCMEFVACSPKVCRQVVRATLPAYLEYCSDVDASLFSYDLASGEEAGESIRSLLNTSVDNRNTVAETLNKVLEEYLDGKDESLSEVAAELAVLLPRLPHRRSAPGQTPTHVVEYWRQFRHRLLTAKRECLASIMSRSLTVARASRSEQLISLTQLAKLHGPKPIFKAAFSVVQSTFMLAVGQNYLYRLVASAESARTCEFVLADSSDLEELASILLEARIPWAGKPDYTDLLGGWLWGGTKAAGPAPAALPKLSPTALFGGLIVAAAAVEAVEGTKQSPAWTRALEHTNAHLGLLSCFRLTLLSRLIPLHVSQVEAELAAAGLEKEHQAWVLKWARGSYNLVRHHGKRLGKAQAGGPGS